MMLRRSRFACLVLCCFAAMRPAARSQGAAQTGYAVLDADAGSRAPVAAALLRYVNAEGVLVSETSFAAAVPRAAGAVVLDGSGPRTGLALVNHGPRSARAALVLRDASGRQIARATRQLAPREQVSRFAGEWFPSVAEGLTGSIGIESDEPIAALAVRESRNRFGEPLYASIPVFDTARAAVSEPRVLPQVAAGPDYETEVVLFNPGPRQVRGTVSLVGRDGGALQLELDGRSLSRLSYSVEAQGTYRAVLKRGDSDAAGYAVVAPEAGDAAPESFALVRHRSGGFPASEAALEAAPAATSASLWVDDVGGYTGIALVNREDREASVTFALSDASGIAVGGLAQKAVPARGQTAIFVHELFPDLGSRFTGSIDVSSSTPVHPLSLKIGVNARGEQILTVLPIADALREPPETLRVFPQIAIGSGFSTQLVLLDPGAAAAGSLAFHRADGSAFPVRSGAETASELRFRLSRGGARRFFPGNTAPLASITLLDPSTRRPTSEVVVHEGANVRPILLALDADSVPRDDFTLSYSSIQPKIARIDAAGAVAGVAPGFSTLRVSAEGASLTATIAVVRVQSGTPGTEAAGVARDLAGRLYLARGRDHAIARAASLEVDAEVFAGVAKSAGLRDDSRLASLFNNPAGLALDQATGDLYVSDAANHAIRRIRPGRADRVETVAGNGAAGSRDGPLAQASFHTPQGIALDHRGGLWVVDSGNHTVRRIDLLEETVTTVAGAPGSPGSGDGSGTDARFSSPVGIALEGETLAGRLAREARGGAAPAVSLVVADTGNGRLRRVREDGAVETIAAPRLDSPSWVAVDAQGSIYVTETGSGRARVVLAGGEAPTVTQPEALSSPRGVATGELGTVVFADGRRSAQRVAYGAPQIESVRRTRAADGDRFTVSGDSFAPETQVLLGSTAAANVAIESTRSISFTAAVLAPGPYVLRLQNRGGLAERTVLVAAPSLSALPPGAITTLAGQPPSIGDGLHATDATLASPFDVTVDSAGNVYVADTFGNRIRRIDAATGVITTVAGDGGSVDSLGSGDGLRATAATVSAPHGVVVDAAGTVYVLDTDDQRVRSIDASTGIIATVAGSGSAGFSGDGGPALDASLHDPYGIAIDRRGNLYVADTFNDRIRRVDRATGVITTVAGTGEQGFSGDLGPATAARLSRPYAVAVDGLGDLYIADSGNNRVRVVSAATGIIRTIAGNGGDGFDGEDGPATQAALTDPRALAVDLDGNVYVAVSYHNVLRRIDRRTGTIDTVVGSENDERDGEDVPAREASLENPRGMAFDAAGNLYIADVDHHRIRRVSAATGLIRTIAGGDAPETAPESALDTELAGPFGVAVDADGNVFIAAAVEDRIRKVDARTGLILTVAGTGSADFNGDDLAATESALAFPEGITVGPRGDLYIADSENHRIRRVDAASGIMATVAGNGRDGFAGDGGAATAAQLSRPNSVAVDAAGNLYVADTGNHRIRKVEAATGTITTIAGDDALGFEGDDGPAVSASLLAPYGVALDRDGNVLIADSGNDRIRRIDAKTGILTTVAGGGGTGWAGDGGPAASAQLAYPTGIAVDSAGNLFIADFDNHRIRRVDAATRIITTVAGTGEPGRDSGGFSGDGGPAVSARLSGPIAVAVDAGGNLYVADLYNDRVRFVRAPAAPAPEGVR